MQLITPRVIICELPDYTKTLRRLENYARLCYGSQRSPTVNGAENLIRKLIDRKPDELDENPPHESVIEHAIISVKFECTAKTAQSFERHRIASFTEASTRFINFGKVAEIPVIENHYWDDSQIALLDEWAVAMEDAERHYLRLLRLGAKPEQARDVLPMGLATTVAMTFNLREARHIFKLRASHKAHPMARELMWPLFTTLRDWGPVFFGDLRINPPTNTWFAEVCFANWDN